MATTAEHIPTPEAPELDLPYYEYLHEGMAGMLSPYPLQSTGDFSREYAFKQELTGERAQEVLAVSLQSQHAETTLGLFENLLALQPGYTTEGRQQPFKSIQTLHKSVHKLINGRCGDTLLALANEHADTPLGERITDLLIITRTDQPLQHTGVCNYALAQLPRRIAADETIAQRESAPEADRQTAAARLSHYAHIMPAVLYNADEPDAQAAFTELLQAEENAAQTFTPILESILADRQGLRIIAKRCGLNTDELADAWRVGYKKQNDANPYHTRQQYQITSLRTILALEQHAKGAAANLRHIFGIRNFGRYPLSLLQKLYDTKDKPAPSGREVLAVCSLNDKGPVLGSQAIMFAVMQEKLDKEGVGFRLFEVASTRELLAAGSRARRYSWTPASVCFFDTHGHKKRGAFLSQWWPGRNVPEYLTGDDFAQLPSYVIDELFAPEAILAFLSCYGAEDDDLAERAHAHTGRKTVGGLGRVVVRGVDVGLEDGRLVPKLELAEKIGNKVFPAVPRYFPETPPVEHAA